MNKAVALSQPEENKRMASRPNLRHHQRINTDLAVEVEASPGNWIKTRISNLSRAGIMLECSPSTLTRILPNHSPVSPRQAVRMRTRFSVPVISVQDVQVNVACDVIYVRRLSQKAFNIGMQFVEFDGSGEEYVNQYIDKNLSGN